MQNLKKENPGFGFSDGTSASEVCEIENVLIISVFLICLIEMRFAIHLITNENHQEKRWTIEKTIWKRRNQVGSWADYRYDSGFRAGDVFLFQSPFA